ncbi:MAG: 16S rRNA (cytidine(1402)-2'-O)-methyltransferase [Elusimicrobia bacterium]|nr:16S rRNA (cytidine(1402)-2'-O)-methyltransferase [Elusimicrobiota bacterium]
MRELKVVATPIGNLGDITERAIRAIREADAVICENAGKTKNLLNSLAITDKIFFQYPADNPFYAKKIFRRTENLDRCVLLTSAGTPVISDPGFLLVKEAIARGVVVTPIPGATSVACLLSVCPVKLKEFIFMGFAPKKKGKLGKKLASFLGFGIPVVMLASKRELSKVASALEDTKIPVAIFVGREMTKKFEEYKKFDKLTKFKLWVEDDLKGEFTLAVFPQKSA